MTEQQYQAVCSNCDSVLILENEEINKGEFTCSECNHKNKFDKKDLVEVTETEEDISEEPVQNAKGKKLYYIIGIIVVALIAFYIYADSSDSITFINRKGKAEKHLKAGTEIFQTQMNSQAPDMQALQNALAEFNKTLEFEPNNIDALFSKAIITTSSGNFPDAITDLDKIIGLSPDFPDAYFYRGFCKLQQGDFQNSLADFNKNLELNPENMSAVFYRANTKYLIKDFTGAKEDMNKIIEKNPQIPNGYALRGLCDVELGNKNSGCEDFKKAKELGFPEADSLIKLHCK